MTGYCGTQSYRQLSAALCVIKNYDFEIIMVLDILVSPATIPNMYSPEESDPVFRLKFITFQPTEL
jgi:hypothetical protein